MALIDRIQQRAREAEELTREQLDTLQNRGRDLVQRSSDNLRIQARRSRRNISQAEVQALDTVSRMLDRLHHATGERAEWLDRGRTFMRQVAEDIQLGNLTVDDLPIDQYDGLGVKKIAVLLQPLSVHEREMVRMYEQAHKNRVSVYRAIDRLNALEQEH